MLYKARFRATNAEKVEADYLTPEQIDKIYNPEDIGEFNGMAEGSYIAHLPDGKYLFLSENTFEELFEVGD